jgi:hypothetical protein
LAQVISTGEPVFVKDLDEESATVIRAIVTQNDGIVYREELFPIEQLETRFENAKRGVELEAYVVKLRRDAQEREFNLSGQMKKALEAHQANNKLIVEG